MFLERDVPWYSDHRDFARSPFCPILLYRSSDELKKFASLVRDADAVIIGSYVPEGIRVADWVTSTAKGTTAFYDIDTPITLRAIQQGNCEYLNTALLPEFDVYFHSLAGRFSNISMRWERRGRCPFIVQSIPILMHR